MSLKMKLLNKYVWILYRFAMNLIMKMISLFFLIFNPTHSLTLMIIYSKYIEDTMVIICRISISLRCYVTQLQEILAMFLQLLKMSKKMMSIYNNYWNKKNNSKIKLLELLLKIWLKNKMLKLLLIRAKAIKKTNKMKMIKMSNKFSLDFNWLQNIIKILIQAIIKNKQYF